MQFDAVVPKQLGVVIAESNRAAEKSSLRQIATAVGTSASQ